MAKLNFDFYKEDINYDTSITKQEENDIIEYINKYNENEFETIFETDIRVPIFVNLSDIRNNIINWYPFKENADVLEIGAGFGSITGELCKKSKTVTSIEFIKKRAEAICKRHKDKDNLEVICGKLEDVNFEKKYDYITLIGIAEYADILFGGLNKLIEYTKTLLNENGVILIAINNKFGVKYLAGATDIINEVPYANMTGIYLNEYKIYGKYELENILKLNNINNYKFYYPLPDYKLTNIIYSDYYLPNENDNKINYNIYYNEDNNILFNELGLIKQFTNNNEFKNFCNSFFIEIGNTEKSPEFISFNNMRKDKYRLKTYLIKDNVIKETINDKSIGHINKIEKNIKELKQLGFNIIDKKENNMIKSRYINSKTFDVDLIGILINEGVEVFLREIEKIYNYIKDKFIVGNIEKTMFEKYDVNIEEDLKKQMHIVKQGYIDLVFQNIFFENGKYLIFDQEWYEDNVPIEFILYRAIFNLYFHNRFIENIIKKEDLYKHFNLLNFINIFEKLEEKWQQSLTNTNVLKFYSNTYTKIKTLDVIKLENKKVIQKKEEEKEKIIANFELIKKELEEKSLRTIQEKEGKINQLNDTLNTIINSRSWKYTKIFRKE
jgi:2-polyprenyl-3-methyl-5-hydroxy-6-metoxy-1,4-benzoquinol methylase